MEFKNVTTKEFCEELREHSALTFEGVIANDDSGNAIEKFIEKHTQLLKKQAYTITGKDMNEWYGLTGGNAYKHDLTFRVEKSSASIGGGDESTLFSY